MTTCKRCNGGGYVATKNGSKRCPFCNRGRARPATDWRYVGLGLGVYVLLIGVTILVGA